MDLGDLGEFLQPEPLTFTVRGKRYEVQQCSAEVGLRLQMVADAMMAAPDASVDVSDAADIAAEQMYRLALGDVYDQVLADGLTFAELERVGVAAFWWQIGLVPLAETSFTGKAAPAAEGDPGPLPDLLRTETPTPTGGATTTRSRASRSGTSGRKGTTRSR